MGVDWNLIWQGDFSKLHHFIHESLEVRCIASAGRGVVTLAPLRAGELLVAEAALRVAPEDRLAEELQEQPLDEIDWQRLDLMCDDSELEEFSKPVPLHSWPGGFGRPRSKISLAKMRRKVDLNAYRCSPPVSEYAFTDDGQSNASKARSEAYGVFPLASLFNHSCAPNMSKVLLGKWVFLRAAREIPPGEELTQFYCDIRMPVEMRQKELSDLFGFSCNCPRCRFELLLDTESEEFQPWKRLYSCAVPLLQQRFSSELEGLIADAERCARRALAERFIEVTETNDKEHEEIHESWALWPLVPAFQQLAARLRLDGRFEESLALWRRSERLVKSVVPLSNIHLRVHSEMLLTSEADADLRENLSLVASAFGPGIEVWQKLVGFRMPRLSKKVMDTSPKPDLCPIHYEWEETEQNWLLVAWSAAFQHAQDIFLDASADVLLFNAPNAVETKVSCSKVHAASMETKFSRRRRSLTVRIPK
ncbi:Histone-lysine N-methyltransferase SMYD3 (SET and MYND domain-containing protein 3) (Zinc finger MYND domain-containing protein 1) [Durusdinium trenchii]|uniref:Histone-lysine N-methyltransferase SMYD3 (SET and MYND domain-containing protein 3) (Zinc finger MYND domain-containing protein 1) n=2 Tax=Durusdinium trenchii TaxID=1381693 RepID=A0ABP0SJB9_9DINO